MLIYTQLFVTSLGWNRKCFEQFFSTKADKSKESINILIIIFTIWKINAISSFTYHQAVKKKEETLIPKPRQIVGPNNMAVKAQKLLKNKIF